MSLREAFAPLCDIGGISPLNPRQLGEDDLSGLRASLMKSGLLNPLLVERQSDSNLLLVLDGGRRWRALMALADAGAIAADYEVPVTIIDGAPATKRELALETSFHRRQLHPVEEYEAFAALEDDGFAPEQIAKDFGEILHHVRQRLALGRLAPEIRAAWRDGTLTAEHAKAFAVADSLEAQRACLELFHRNAEFVSPAVIRSHLRSDAISADAPEALFVGLDAYLAAGGHADEDLFSAPAMIWRDGSLAGRLAAEKLEAEGKRIAAEEGWGFIVVARADRRETVMAHPKLAKPAYLAAEIDRRAAIGFEMSAPNTPAETLDALERKLDAIEAKAILRSLTRPERAALGLFVGIDDAGALSVTRGVLRDDAVNNVSDSAPFPKSGAVPREAADPTPAASREKSSRKEHNSDELRLVLFKAVEQGFRECIAGDVGLALMVGVTALANSSVRAFVPFNTQIDCDGLGLDIYALSHQDSFEEALALAAEKPLCDLTTFFCKLVARSCEVHVDGMLLSDLAPIAGSFRHRGAPLAAAFARALDYDHYFAAATKDAALKAIEACDSQAAAAEAGKLKKDALKARAATLARDRKWLPAPLDAWAQLPQGADEAIREASQEGPDAPAAFGAEDDEIDVEIDVEIEEPHARLTDARKICVAYDGFFADRCRLADQAFEKASILYESYVDYCGDYREPSSQTVFSAALIADGFTKKRLKNGVHYYGLALSECV
ncbi:ParB/RepB/Spo0J family partition protein [Methylovirgula sp. HY1]|uniref:ParB/RepB/Spo0J family partition protein n=1 Tax=Methylovirgula sp. HY1 TaxID=2822761 RepID=UPI001C5A93D8|nr:ParB/RepB/Spo0J family partition protein [Methylovirgula sp. HY1]QXX74266.1 Chromosome-partitioning protein Spo0J [Methylovirgula sp. HY1]